MPSDRPLDQRVAIVTGASSGIGSACAVALGAAGARVVVNYHGSEDGAQDTVAEVEARGGEAFEHKADVSDEVQVDAMFAEAVRRYGRVDILVNNAGIQKDASLLDMEVSDWDAVMNIDLRGSFLCARAAARHFCGRETHWTGAAGNIIFMTSVHERIPWAGHANYAAAKAGTAMLMKSCAQEFGHERIRVNAVAPGAIKTAINQEVWESEEGRRDMLSKIPYGRIGEPEDVAKAVVWLASDDSDYVHGHTLIIDGGMTLHPHFREGG